MTHLLRGCKGGSDIRAGPVTFFFGSGSSSRSQTTPARNPRRPRDARPGVPRRARGPRHLRHHLRFRPEPHDHHVVPRRQRDHPRRVQVRVQARVPVPVPVPVAVACLRRRRKYSSRRREGLELRHARSLAEARGARPRHRPETRDDVPARRPVERGGERLDGEPAARLASERRRAALVRPRRAPRRRLRRRGPGPGPGGRRDAREDPTTLSSPPAGNPPPSSSPSASSPERPSRTSGSSPGARSAHATTGAACAPRNSRTHFPLAASQSNALPSLCPASTHRDAFAANEAEEEPPEEAADAPSKREDATAQNASAETVAPGVGTPIATHSRRPPSSDDARRVKVFFFSRPIAPAGRSGGPRG